jgi:hypothetical protein
MNTCISPEQIEAWELEAYLHGDAPARVVQHVTRCPGCSARANELRGFHQRLQGALARVDCPSVETLSQHRWRQLPLERARETDAHLASCVSCRTEYAAFAGPEPGPAQQFLRAPEVVVGSEVTAPPVRPEPARGWIEQGLAQGRAWLEPLTQRWREVQLYLDQLLTGPDARPAYALAGLMGEGAPSDWPVTLSGRFAPELANFELTLVVTPEPALAGEMQCQLEVTITLHDSFGDYSGVAVPLSWGDQGRTGTTDSLGKVIFEHLPCWELLATSLMLRLPD